MCRDAAGRDTDNKIEAIYLPLPFPTRSTTPSAEAAAIPHLDFGLGILDFGLRVQISIDD